MMTAPFLNFASVRHLNKSCSYHLIMVASGGHFHFILERLLRLLFTITTVSENERNERKEKNENYMPKMNPLLYPPALPLAGVSIGMERGCQ